MTVVYIALKQVPRHSTEIMGVFDTLKLAAEMTSKLVEEEKASGGIIFTDPGYDASYDTNFYVQQWEVQK